MTNQQHTVEHLPPFITAPGETDILLGIVAVVLILAVLAGGVFFLWLHSLPERMVHNKIQFDIVAVLALLSLFTHIHAFWVAALLIALIDFHRFSIPDLSSSLGRIASSLEKLAGSGRIAGPETATETKPVETPTEIIDSRGSRQDNRRGHVSHA
jgi:hypothetical protein